MSQLHSDKLERSQETENSSMKYKRVVQHLIKYASALSQLTDRPCQEHLQPGQDEKAVYHQLDSDIIQQQQREHALEVLQQEEAVLTHLYPSSPYSSSSPIRQLTCHAKHSYLLGTLNDLKHGVLEGYEYDEGKGYQQDMSRDQPHEAHNNLNASLTNKTADDVNHMSSRCSGDYGERRIRFKGGEAAVAVGAAGGGDCKVKRLNKTCTAALTHWLLTHLSAPFPTPQEKEQLAANLGLEPAQVIDQQLIFSSILVI